MPAETLSEAVSILEWLWIRLLIAMVSLALLVCIGCLISLVWLLISGEQKTQQDFIQSVTPRPLPATDQWSNFRQQRRDRLVTPQQLAQRHEWVVLDALMLSDISLDRHQTLVDWSQLSTLTTKDVIYTPFKKS